MSSITLLWKNVNMLWPIVALFIILGFNMDLSRRGCWPSLIHSSPGRLCWMGRAVGESWGAGGEGRGRSCAAENRAGSLPRGCTQSTCRAGVEATATLEPGSWSLSTFGGLMLAPRGAQTHGYFGVGIYQCHGCLTCCRWVVDRAGVT